MEEQKTENVVEDLKTPTTEEVKKDVANKEETKETSNESPSFAKKIKIKKPKIDKEKDELIKANLDLKEKVLRITAEMQNMKRRYDLDISNIYKYEGEDLITKILPVIDNFERALSIKVEGGEKFTSGFKMIYDNLLEILKSKGITEIDCLHQEFNPTTMNAVMTDTNPELANNVVLEVLQKGYMYKDKIIRPAMVKVNERND